MNEGCLPQRSCVSVFPIPLRPSSVLLVRRRAAERELRALKILLEFELIALLEF